MNEKLSISRPLVATAFFIAALFIAGVEAQTPTPAGPQQPAVIEVHESVRNDTSGPLAPRSVLAAPSQRREIEAPRLNPNRVAGGPAFAPGTVDKAIQSKLGPAVPIDLRSSVDGLGRTFKDAQGHSMPVDVAPPDTNGAVGDSQYVQIVNTSFAVFDKKNLTKPTYGFVPVNWIWRGFGGPCEKYNDGDPIVQYDKIARRWIITQFRTTDGFSQCIAVSTTSDALGGYHRYEFSEPSLNDYPKMGVWPDGYYITYNMFGDPQGARICAYEREKMLTGDKAREVAVQLNSKFFSLLPSDFDGVADADHLPPANSPCFFLSLGTAANTLDLWKFKVDWANPTASTFGDSKHDPDKTFQVSPFIDATSLDNVPQVGTSQKLDALGDRLLYRLAYRRFDDHHESMLVTHCIQSTAVAAIRWYEIRDPNGDLRIFQQGTFSPDSICRWMASAAMDKFGNLAIGYSASSSRLHPSIRVAAQKANPQSPNLGVLGAETLIVDSKSSQDGTSRWGDYSAMSIDPADDSTFYFTTLYLAQTTNGAYNWSTRIASFTVK